MSEKQLVILPFLISLIGGIIVFVLSLVNLVWFGSSAPNWGGFGNYMRNMMGSNHNFMGNYASSTNFFAALSMVALVCGIIVIIGALVLRVHPQERILWGIVIIVFSAVSLAGMGGYFVGAILGILGGVLALTSKAIGT